MSQTTMGSSAPTPNSRPAVAAGADAPDILFIVKHYRWMLVIGTLAGLVLGVGGYIILKKTSPRYSVYAQFRVAPSSDQRMFDDNRNSMPTDTAEDILRTIRSQALLIKSDSVLEKVLQTDAFQKNPDNPDRKSEWLEKNIATPKPNLRQQIEVAPEPNSYVFKVGMTDRDPKELERLVNAIADTYFAELRNDERSRDSVRISEARTAADKMRREVRSLSESMDNYRKDHDITAITNEHTVVQSTLAQLNTKIVEAELKVTAAKSSYENIKKQIDNAKFPLTAEMEQLVENDPTLRYLEQSKLQLQQDREAMLIRNGEGHAIIQGTDAKIRATQRQIDEKREELRRQARIRMQENSEQDIKTAEAVMTELINAREKETLKFKDLDRALVEYKNLQDEFDSKKKLMNEASEIASRAELQRGTDWSRIQKFSAAVAPDPEEISFPKLKVFGPGGFLLGLAVSFGIAYLLELTNTRIRTPRDVTRTMQLPLLGFVPDQQEDSFLNGDLATSVCNSPGSMTAESFRLIRGRLSAQTNGTTVHTLLVASISPGGGATTVASNLAHSMALNGLRVLLVDANFYRPGLRQVYSNIPEVGLTDVVDGKATLDKAVVVTPQQPRLHVMGPGTAAPTAAAQLLEGRAFNDLLSQLKNSYDFIVFDAAPLSLVADSVALAAKSDGVIAVVRAGIITRGVVGRVREQLRNVHANLIGVVLNATRTHGSGYFKENYRTFYEYAGGRPGEQNRHTPIGAGRR